jgi:hypothetical protein
MHSIAGHHMSRCTVRFQSCKITTDRPQFKRMSLENVLTKHLLEDRCLKNCQ